MLLLEEMNKEVSCAAAQPCSILQSSGESEAEVSGFVRGSSAWVKNKTLPSGFSSKACAHTTRRTLGSTTQVIRQKRQVYFYQIHSNEFLFVLYSYNCSILLLYGLFHICHIYILAYASLLHDQDLYAL